MGELGRRADVLPIGGLRQGGDQNGPMLSGGDARTPYRAASSAAAVAGLLSPFTLLIFFRKNWAESVIGLGEAARKRNNNNNGLDSFVGVVRRRWRWRLGRDADDVDGGGGQEGRQAGRQASRQAGGASEEVGTMR